MKYRKLRDPLSRATRKLPTLVPQSFARVTPGTSQPFVDPEENAEAPITRVPLYCPSSTGPMIIDQRETEEGDQGSVGIHPNAVPSPLQVGSFVVVAFCEVERLRRVRSWLAFVVVRIALVPCREVERLRRVRAWLTFVVVGCGSGIVTIVVARRLRVIAWALVVVGRTRAIVFTEPGGRIGGGRQVAMTVEVVVILRGFERDQQIAQKKTEIQPNARGSSCRGNQSRWTQSSCLEGGNRRSGERSWFRDNKKSQRQAEKQSIKINSLVSVNVVVLSTIKPGGSPVAVLWRGRLRQIRIHALE